MTSFLVALIFGVAVLAGSTTPGVKDAEQQKQTAQIQEEIKKVEVVIKPVPVEPKLVESPEPEAQQTVETTQVEQKTTEDAKVEVEVKPAEETEVRKELVEEQQTQEVKVEPKVEPKVEVKTPPTESTD